MFVSLFIAKLMNIYIKSSNTKVKYCMSSKESLPFILKLLKTSVTFQNSIFLHCVNHPIYDIKQTKKKNKHAKSHEVHNMDRWHIRHYFDLSIFNFYQFLLPCRHFSSLQGFAVYVGILSSSIFIKVAFLNWARYSI